MSSSPSTDPGLQPTLVIEVLPPDPGKALYEAFIKELLRRVSDPAAAAQMTASEFEVIRKVCSDNSISLQSIRRGDFGATAQRVIEEFPFPEGGMTQ